MRKVHKLVIIGAGPAGLTAAIYASRANLSPVLIQGPKPGGQLMGTTELENWPGMLSGTGPQLMIDMINHAKKLSTEIVDGSVNKVDLQQRPFKLFLDTDKELYANSIIIACGATPNRLRCDGEEKYFGKGVSTCAVCDGAFYKNQSIVVVGGGNSSIESASFLLKNDNKVTIVHIGDKLTASYSMQERVINNPNISILYNSTVVQIKGDNNRVTGVKIINKRTDEIKNLDVDGIFLAIGLKPNTEMFDGQLELLSSGHIKVIDNVKTSVDGVFAAGDVQDCAYRQAIVAAGFGCMASLQAERYLSNKNL